jgi:hypothetical protein
MGVLSEAVGVGARKGRLAAKEAREAEAPSSDSPGTAVVDSLATRSGLGPDLIGVWMPRGA